MSYLGSWWDTEAIVAEVQAEAKKTQWSALLKKGQDALDAGSKKALEIVEKKKKRALSPESPNYKKDEGEGPPYLLYAVIGLVAYFGLKGSGNSRRGYKKNPTGITTEYMLIVMREGFTKPSKHLGFASYKSALKAAKMWRKDPDIIYVKIKNISTRWL